MTAPSIKQIARKIRFPGVILLTAIHFAITVYAKDVILSWDRPDDARVTGYEIFYGPNNDDFKSSPKEIVPSPEETQCEIFGLITGETYSFAAKSFDNFGNKSVFSEVIFYKVPSDDDNSTENNKKDNSNDGNDDSDKTDDSEDNQKIDGDESTSSNSSGGGGGCFIQMIII